MFFRRASNFLTALSWGQSSHHQHAYWVVFIVIKCLSDDLFIMLQAWAWSCAGLHLNVLLPPWWFFPEETKSLHSYRWRFLYNKCSPASHLSWVSTLYCQRLIFLPPTIPVYDRQSGLKLAQQCHPSGEALIGAGCFTWKMGKMGKDKTQKIQEATFKFLTFYHSKHNPKKSAPLPSICIQCNNTYWSYSDSPTCSGMLS